MIPRPVKIGLVLFFLYMLFTAPAATGNAVRGAGAILGDAGNSMRVFVTTVFG